MAIRDLRGAERWNGLYDLPYDTRVLYSSESDETANRLSDLGRYWNISSASIPEAGFTSGLDVSGQPTNISLRQITGFTGKVGSFTSSATHGYADVLGAQEIIGNSHYTSGTAVVELYGFQAGDIVDLVYLGQAANLDDLRHTIVSVQDKQAEIASRSDATGTGPVLFRDLIPRDGAIRITMENGASFGYMTLLDIRIRHRR